MESRMENNLASVRLRHARFHGYIRIEFQIFGFFLKHQTSIADCYPIQKLKNPTKLGNPSLGIL